MGTPSASRSRPACLPSGPPAAAAADGVATFGAVHWSTRVNGFRYTLTEHRPGLRLGKHSHDSASLNFVLTGLYDERFAGADRRHAPSALVYKPPGETHSNLIDSAGARCLLVEISDDCFAALPDTPSSREAWSLTDPGLAGLAERLLAELAAAGGGASAAPDVDARLAIESLTLDLLAGVDGPLDRRDACDPRWLADVDAYLRERLDRPATLREIAAHIGVHHAHLSRTFRRAFGVTVGERWRQHRAAAGARRLRLTTDPLAIIAPDLGFHDQSHFSRVFQRAVGLPPGAYRRLHRANCVQERA